ncbi:MAG: hypothetical protein ACRD3D_11680 [Terriglobia bacterium]
MPILAGIAGCVLAALVFLDAFETVVLARRSHRGFRITQIFYQITWAPFAALARRIQSGKRRENYLSVYGPLSLLALLGFWAVSLIIAFGLLEWSAGASAPRHPDFATAVYSSAGAFFTLGEMPHSSSRWLTIVEAGLGFVSSLW